MASSEPSCSDGAPSDTSKSTTTANASSPSASETEFSTPHQCSAMFVTSYSPVQLRNTKELRTFLQQDFHANRFQKPARTEALTTTATSFPNSSQSFAQFDRKTSSWRTSQICLLTNTSEPFSENWPRSGMTVDGIAYRRPPVAPHTGGTGFGSLPSHSIPTPTTQDHIERKSTSTEKLNPKTNKSVTLDRFVKFFPDHDPVMLCKTPSEYDGRTKHPKKDEYRLGHSGTLAQEVTSGFLESVRKWPVDTLWPTPTVKGNFNRKGLTKTSGDGLETAVKKRPADELWPTSRASEWKGTGPLGSKSQAYRLDRKYLDATVQEAEQRTGKLNPEWVDWLMGVPTGFTACAPLAMVKFQSWWQQHGGS